MVEAILDAAADLGASAVAFQPRRGARILQFLSGDRSLRLITDADIPVISLPGDDE